MSDTFEDYPLEELEENAGKEYRIASGAVPHIQNASFRSWVEGSAKWSWLMWPSRMCTHAQYAAAMTDAMADYIDDRLGSGEGKK